MRTTIFLAAIFVLSSQFCMGQGVGDAVDKVDNTVSQVNKANETLGKLKGLLPKKKNKTAPADSSKINQAQQSKVNDSAEVSGLKTTMIKITGIDYTTLKKLYTNVQACEGVIEAKMKFGAEASSIEIKHTGTTEEILNLIQLTSSDIFTDNNITALEEGSVSLKLK